MVGLGLHGVFQSTAFDVARDLLLFVAAVFWLGLAFWVHRDARRRLDDGVLVGIATAVGLVPFLGPLVYLLFRPPETLVEIQSRELELRAIRQHLRRPDLLCPVCRSAVEASYLVCPVCTVHLKEPCTVCKAPLEPLWQTCPYCATPVGAHVEALPVGPVDLGGADLDAALTAEAAAVPQPKRSRRAAAS